MCRRIVSLCPSPVRAQLEKVVQTETPLTETPFGRLLAKESVTEQREQDWMSQQRLT